MVDQRQVSLTRITFVDLPFLVLSGLDRERVGVQYPANEYRKQFKIAPLRYFRRVTRTLSRIIRVNAKRAGYVGLNPLSGNIEYYLMPWARGGVGGRAIEQYLREALPFEVDKHAFMLESNERSVRVFRTVLKSMGLLEGSDFEYFEYPGGDGYPGGRGFRLFAGTTPRNEGASE
jgi:hypothetical protein